MRQIRILWAACLGLGSVGSAAADEAKARGMLDGVTAFYRSQETLSVNSLTTISVSVEGQPEGMKQTIKQSLKIKRPNRFALVSEGEGVLFSAPSAYLKDTVATMKLEGQGWLQAEGISSIEAMFRNPDLGFDEKIGGNILFDQNLTLAFLNKLLFRSIGQGWEEDLAGLRYVGEDTVGKLKAHHLALTTETQQFGEPAKMELNIWIQQGEEPFLLKLAPDMSKLFPQQEGQPKMAMKMVGEWSDWNRSPTLTEDDFTAPKPGEGEKTFPNFNALMSGQMASENPALELTGTKAEDFTLPLLGGTEFKLSDQKGKRLVVISFWATWSSPDAESLKALARVQEKVKGREVTIIAINVTDQPEAVKAYLKEMKVENLTVALDTKETVVPQFKVHAIPQTMVVGKDGEINQVHIGMDEAFEAELLEQIEALLAVESGTSAP
ncbi:MAG: peroxiredoxin [Verrucomicrobiales bacterium]|jgi:peroxiredoxin